LVRRYVADAWPAMARLGMTADASPDAWRFCATAEEAVMEAEFVQENAPDRLATRRELYTRLDPVMPADTVQASSTSGLIMSENGRPASAVPHGSWWDARSTHRI
jgi:3-hydroxybutyryl-CoA dehydrogenase